MAEVRTIEMAKDGRKSQRITLMGKSITPEVVAKWKELGEFKLTTQKGEEKVKVSLDLPDYLAQTITELHTHYIVEKKN